LRASDTVPARAKAMPDRPRVISAGYSAISAGLADLAWRTPGSKTRRFPARPCADPLDQGWIRACADPLDQGWIRARRSAAAPTPAQQQRSEHAADQQREAAATTDRAHRAPLGHRVQAHLATLLSTGLDALARQGRHAGRNLGTGKHILAVAEDGAVCGTGRA